MYLHNKERIDLSFCYKKMFLQLKNTTIYTSIGYVNIIIWSKNIHINKRNKGRSVKGDHDSDKVCTYISVFFRERGCGRRKREMWRMRRWVNVSPRKDTRCALRELTRESRVPSMKHGTPEDVRKKDDYRMKRNKMDREREEHGYGFFVIIFLFMFFCSSKGNEPIDDATIWRRYRDYFYSRFVPYQCFNVGKRYLIAIEVLNMWQWQLYLDIMSIF